MFLHIDCALYYLECALLPVLRWLLLLGRVDLGDELNFTVEDLNLVIVSKASSPLFDHVDKIPVPSHSRKCMFRMSPWYVLPLVEHIPLHDLSFCHSSKQTTILADIGVDYYLVAPATVTDYCMLRVVTWDYFAVSRDGSDHVNDGGNVLVNLP